MILNVTHRTTAETAHPRWRPASDIALPDSGPQLVAFFSIVHVTLLTRLIAGGVPAYIRRLSMTGKRRATAAMLPQPRKLPKQERARQAVAAIEQACLKILETEGPRHLTTNRIAEVAGVNIASLYQYFPNKEAILASVYAAKVRAEIDTIIRRSPVLEKIANQSLEDALRGLVQSYLDSRRRLAHIDAEFYGKYQAIFDVNLRREANQQAVIHGRGTFDRWFLAILNRNRARLRVTDFALANFVVTRTIEGLIRLAVEERPELLDSPAFQEEILALLLRYLVAGPP